MLAGAALLLLARVPFNASEIARLGRYELIPTWVYVTVWPMDDLIDGLGYPITSNASEVLHDRLSHRLQRVETKIWLMRARGRIEAGHAAELSHIQTPLTTKVFELGAEVKSLRDPMQKRTSGPTFLDENPPPRPPIFAERNDVVRNDVADRQIDIGTTFLEPCLEVIEYTEALREDGVAFQPWAVSLCGSHVVITCRKETMEVVERIFAAIRQAIRSEDGTRIDVTLHEKTFAVFHTRTSGPARSRRLWVYGTPDDLRQAENSVWSSFGTAEQIAEFDRERREDVENQRK